MRKETDIDALMAETWLTVTLLKQGATTPDGDVLYDTCSKQVESVRGALDRAGYDEASIDHISYAQCALLDEVVMSRKLHDGTDADAGQVAWRKAPLQARYFGSLHAGEALWDRIAEVLRQPAPDMAVLTCYHRVIALGFQGLYSMGSVSQSQRAAKIVPIIENAKQKGTIVVSTEEIFDGSNKEHIGKANDIEIKLLDLGLLPLMTEL
ncbi:DotU family type IV/VI secretion system protein [Enterobacter cloacae]|uniref:type VI secretion system protein TssL, short form n=1 Tax=Enterobacter cloacae TaxID=550 RepID=UPI00188D238B|nr:type VI secretion system protein TssL, short form [Enterobacter cloacae]MBF4155441.1 DotU family type IV/VI secretion system protein [Enterobacter cloacae]HAS0918211.1 DotU family type IV/VI secretion system protein [Enterobacter cloacae]